MGKPYLAHPFYLTNLKIYTMIGIGINENVYLDKVILDDKDVLAITFKNLPAPGAKKLSVFEEISASEVVDEAPEMTIRMFPMNGPKEDDSKTLEQKVDLARADIAKFKGICNHLLKGYMTSEEMKNILNPTRGIAIDEANTEQQITQKVTMNQISKNMAQDFVNAIRPYCGNPAAAFRLLLVRQSKDKHFATFRGRYLDENPFWESMSVPKEASKLKFTPWELANGYNLDTPVVKPTNPAAGNAAAGGEADTAENLFK